VTIRSRPDFKEPATELRDRILALGRAHDLVRSRAGGTALEPPARLSGLLRTVLAAYQDPEERRIVITGVDVEIDDRSATPLALFVHELATNAAKYGALSDGGGRVEISISKAEEVELGWSESGGPRVSETGERGFGSSLAEMSIVRQLGGTLAYDWREEGLRVTARIPAAVMTR
jgi:two-component sensor histidine kinase